MSVIWRRKSAALPRQAPLGDEERVALVAGRRAVRDRAERQPPVLGLRRVGDRDGDVDPAVLVRDARRAGGLRRQVDGVRVERRDGRARAREPEAAALVDRREAVGLLDDDAALAGARDAQVEPGGEQPVVERIGRRDGVVDRAAGALDVEREDVTGHVAGHVHRVVAEPADHARRDARGGREDVDRVVALERVDLEHLDPRVGDPDADAVDRARRDDDVVGVLGAEDDELVEARAAVDRDGRVHVVLDLVRARAGADVALGGGREAGREPRHRDLVLRVDPDDVAVVVRRARVAVGAGRRVAAVRLRLREREAADDEQVVVVAALEPQRRLVRVDGEDVVADVADGDERLRGARESQPRVVATVPKMSCWFRPAQLVL